MHNDRQIRTYNLDDCVVFRKTKETWGGLSNMASGFDLKVNGIHIRTSEALYQSCRFPHMPEVQKYIINEYSPITAKMKSKKYRSESRSDWFKVRVKIMKWCLKVKLAQNLSTFGDLLLSTENRPIVEKKTRRADFWAANEKPNGTLVGMNVLGRLLMELRENLRDGNISDFRHVRPLGISDFLLSGNRIGVVTDISKIENRSHLGKKRSSSSSSSFPFA